MPFISGGSIDGIDNVSPTAGGLYTWRGGNKPVGCTSTWNDSNLTAHIEQWTIAPGGGKAAWEGDLDIAIGGIYTWDGDTYAAAAAGAYDARWTGAVQRIANNRAGKSGTTYIRPLHEFNADFYSWGLLNISDIPNFIAAWRRYYGIIKSVFPAAKVVWSPNRETVTASAIKSTDAWPGDAYVDVVGPDIYLQYPGVLSQAEWDAQLMGTDRTGGPKGPGAWLAFAKAHGKKFALPEWGVNSEFGDQAEGMTAYLNWLKANEADILYANYFNTGTLNDGFQGRFGVYPETKMPNAAAAYRTWHMNNLDGATTTPGTGTGTTPSTGTGTGNGIGAVLYSNDGSGTTGATVPTTVLALGANPGTGGGATFQDGVLRLTTGSTGGYNPTDKILRRLPISPVADVDLRFDYRYNGDGALTVAVRSDKETADSYEGRAYALNLNNPAQTKVFNNYSETLLGSRTSPAPSANTWYSVHFRVYGSRISASVWAKGTTEPTSWNAGDVTDSAVTAAGYIMFTLAGGGDATRYVELDNIQAAVPTATVSGLLPPLQSSIKATAFSSTRIDLVWAAATGATSYDIERDGTVIVNSLAATSYSDTGLAAASSHSYRIRSVS